MVSPLVVLDSQLERNDTGICHEAYNDVLALHSVEFLSTPVCGDWEYQRTSTNKGRRLLDAVFYEMIKMAELARAWDCISHRSLVNRQGRWGQKERCL